ncbi:prenyltransferase/squalene oxidase repeat-containing protein [Novipirellula caenicola]|uniref:Squalene cyclase C-terminal domain-containing protein n=1 Tax=Novipirellula caenicola TaxID=1536901 RepID=A0ABP9VRG3_9BACT
MPTSSNFILLPFPATTRVRKSPPRWRDEPAEANVNRSRFWFQNAKPPLTCDGNQTSAVSVTPYSFQQIKDRVVNAPAWLLSTIFHLVLLLILAFITISPETVQGIMLTITPASAQSKPEFVEFSIAPMPQLDDALVASDSNVGFETQVDVAPLFHEIAVTQPLPFDSELPAVNPFAQLPKTSGAAIGNVPNASQAVSMFRGRTGEMKKVLLAKYGGTQVTEDAVALGLAWLIRQQRTDGSWSLRGPYRDGSLMENETAATAMAMIALMGAGNTHRSGKYERQMLKAAQWLVKQQNRVGFMAERANPHEKMYAQGLATIALCELYGMTHDYWLRPYAQLACDFGVDAQSPQGGWRYQPKFDSDTSVTGWFLMGLKSGEAAGLDVDRYVFMNIEKYLDTVGGGGYDQGYGYQVGEVATRSMTAEGLLIRQYLGWQRNRPEMSHGLGGFVARDPIDRRDMDVYYWYYATQALHHYGGPLWEEWNEKMRVELPAMQEKNGGERGSWSPLTDAWGAFGGRLYTTCFSLYSLEVYYRHMPLYAGQAPAAAEVDNE